MGQFLGITVEKGWPHVGAWMGTLKNPTINVYGVGSPTSSSVRQHIYCAVTYMTEM